MAHGACTPTIIQNKINDMEPLFILTVVHT